MTVSTRVCCSMISDTHTAYAEGCPRQGSIRWLTRYQANSLEESRFIRKKESTTPVVGFQSLETLTPRNQIKNTEFSLRAFSRTETHLVRERPCRRNSLRSRTIYPGAVSSHWNQEPGGPGQDR